jgi:hypothetical protein
MGAVRLLPLSFPDRCRGYAAPVFISLFNPGYFGTLPLSMGRLENREIVQKWNI